MTDKEAREVAEVVAPLVAAAVAEKLKETSTAKVEEHNRILRGSNGDIGLIARVFNLETTQRRFMAIISAVGVAFLIDVVARLWQIIVTHSTTLPLP